MPVVINEFEVIPAPSQQQSGAPPPGQAEAPGRLDPTELAKAMRQAAERLARVWAH